MLLGSRAQRICVVPLLLSRHIRGYDATLLILSGQVFVGGRVPSEVALDSLGVHEHLLVFLEDCRSLCLNLIVSNQLLSCLDSVIKWSRTKSVWFMNIDLRDSR